MPKIENPEISSGTGYPAPFDAPCKARRSVRLSKTARLTAIGVNVTTLAPDAWSSQRHWHSHEDELVYVLSGELVLVEDEGETILTAGEAAAFPAGVQNGHHLQNRSEADATFLVVSNRDDRDHGAYSDIDMTFGAGRYSKPAGSYYSHKDGTPY